MSDGIFKEIIDENIVTQIKNIMKEYIIFNNIKYMTLVFLIVRSINDPIIKLPKERKDIIINNILLTTNMLYKKFNKE